MENWLSWPIAKPVVFAALRIVVAAGLAALMAVPALVELLPDAVARCLVQEYGLSVSKSSLDLRMPSHDPKWLWGSSPRLHLAGALSDGS